MELYSETKEFKLYHGSMLDMLSVIKPKSIDSIVTDPPYELNFMGKGWDNSGIAFQKATWEKCFQVLKPGGYLLAFGGSRTFHRIACTIEDAGFEIRDTIMWLYGSGFPKSMNIGLAIDKKNGVESEIIGKSIKGSSPLAGNHNGEWCDGQKDGEFFLKRANNEWAGWGTALKPAYEPVIVARKPCEGSCIDNVIQYGVGGINIDGCRIGDDEITTNIGRFPPNVVLTYDKTDFNEVCGALPSENGESAARYYYCAKASTRDRDEGLNTFSEKQTTSHRNTHPTVKPVDLMQYLVRLVTPESGIVLDPFNGSGSTGKAVMYENKDRQANYKYIGIELSAEYLPIAEARIMFAANNNVPIEAHETPITGQITFDDLIENISKGEN